MMQTFVRPSRDLRNHYAEISEMLRDHDHVIITNHGRGESCLLYTSPSPRDAHEPRMPSSA